MKIKLTKKSVQISLIVLLLLLIPFVSSMGIGSEYSTVNTLKLYPGETKDIQVRLVSNDIDPNKGNIVVKADLVDSAGIATLVDGSKEYSISSGKDGIVTVRFSIPNDVQIGKDYTIILRSSLVQDEKSSGTVSFSFSTSFSIKAVIVEKPVAQQTEQPVVTEPVKSNNNLWWITLIIVVILVIAVIYYMKKPGKKRR